MTKRILALAALLLVLVAGTAQNLPDPMKPRRLINDFAGILSDGQRAALEKKLADFARASSTQITVVTVDSLQGLAVHDYATRLGEKWGVGQKGKDNGVILLVKPKTAREKGQAAISVGYGLEGVIPDITASRIVRDEMIPAFQRNDYYAGIDRAAGILADLAAGEYTADEYESQGNGAILAVGIIIALVILSLLFRRRGGGSYTPGHSSGGGGFFIFPMGGGGGFGSFSGGSGSFGGFGGFGGGSFGGGGASGDW